MTSPLPAPPPPAGAGRVRGYLISQAERRDWIDLWPRIASARLELLDALSGFTTSQANWRPRAGEWTAVEVAAHLLDYTDSVLQVIEALARGRTPDHTPVDALGQAPAELAEQRRLLRRLTEQAVRITVLPERLPSITDDMRHAPTYAHPWFGELPARAWFAFLRIHDEDHLGQLRQITAADGFSTTAQPEGAS